MQSRRTLASIPATTTTTGDCYIRANAHIQKTCSKHSLGRKAMATNLVQETCGLWLERILIAIEEEGCWHAPASMLTSHSRYCQHDRASMLGRDFGWAAVAFWRPGMAKCPLC